MNIKISVILPSLNVGKYIEECLKSVRNQTLQDIEIICVDAGSTDGTIEILERFAVTDSRISLIYSEKKSYGYQVNLGIKHARGKYIGIVETDDFVNPEMFEQLWNIAETYNLEYVKGECKHFVCLDNGDKFIWTNNSLRDRKDLYNKIINPSQIPFLYARDFNVWKGIYNKSFLVDNGIWFNESQGAAYQDIGFSELVIGCGRRAWYMDKAFYCYRTDRDESSVNSLHGLRYSQNEFQRLINNNELFQKIVSKEGFYSHMLQSFLGELKKTLKSVGYDINSEYIYGYLNWFKQILKDKYMYSYDNYAKKEFEYILKDTDEYVNRLQEEERYREENRKLLILNAKERKVVVFGAGVRGNAAIRFLMCHNIIPVAICDNNRNLWGQNIQSIDVLSPDTCVNKYKNTMFLIANKNYYEDIKCQLLNMGVDSNLIYEFQ